MEVWDVQTVEYHEWEETGTASQLFPSNSQEKFMTRRFIDGLVRISCICLKLAGAVGRVVCG